MTVYFLLFYSRDPLGHFVSRGICSADTVGIAAVGPYCKADLAIFSPHGDRTVSYSQGCLFGIVVIVSADIFCANGFADIKPLVPFLIIGLYQLFILYNGKLRRIISGDRIRQCDRKAHQLFGVFHAFTGGEGIWHTNHRLGLRCCGR